jgi:putative holliday junction resolvase
VKVLLGLDVGDRRVGVAVSDAMGLAAHPLTVFSRGTPADDASVVARLAREQRVEELVVGLPLLPDGSEAEQVRLTRTWADEIARRTELLVSWQDERLTTVLAEAAQPRLRRDRTTGSPTRAAVRARRVRVDLGAAVRILQAALDARTGPGAAGMGPTPELDDRDSRDGGAWPRGQAPR